MKCEKCERDLVGESVICADCGHDSSLRKAALAMSEDQARVRATPVNGEANLIHFPKTNQTSTSSEADGVPVWRDVVKERVRQFREQRPEVAVFVPTDEAPANPIVEAALRRLSKPPEYAESRAQSYSSAATAALPHERQDPDSDRPSAFRRETAGLLHPNQLNTALPITRSAEAGSARSVNGADRSASKNEPPRAESAGKTAIQPLNPPQPATLWDRTLAGLFDFALILLACVPLYSIHSITGLKFGQSAAYAVLGIAVWITFIYQMWTMLVSRRTCGMAWRHLRVFDSETREPIFPQWRLFVRALCGPISILLPPLNLAVIWVSGNQSGLGDLLSQTTLLQTHASVSSPAQT
jgi:uncharacterized RDD family membrane protein YckC